MRHLKKEIVLKLKFINENKNYIFTAMPNISGNAYALTTLCPIKSGHSNDESNACLLRRVLQELDENNSPFAKVPNTYLARLFILDDTIFESHPYTLDRLQSKYLVFTANIHGDLDTYLDGMWANMQEEIKAIGKYFVGFGNVNSAASFKEYLKKCQVKTTFFFNGSTDDSLQEQLKSLYLKQEFSKFVYEHQGVSSKQLLHDFREFVKISEPKNLAFPTWKAGARSLKDVVVTKNNRA